MAYSQRKSWSLSLFMVVRPVAHGDFQLALPTEDFAVAVGVGHDNRGLIALHSMPKLCHSAHNAAKIMGRKSQAGDG